MDADTELDLALGQVEDDLPVGWWDARGQRHTERTRAIVDPLRDVGDLGQVTPSFCRGAGDLLREHCGAYAAAARGVERVLDRHVVIDDDRGDLDAFVGCILGRKLEVENVACVVLYAVDDPRAPLDRLPCRA